MLSRGVTLTTAVMPIRLHRSSTFFGEETNRQGEGDEKDESAIRWISPKTDGAADTVSVDEEYGLVWKLVLQFARSLWTTSTNEKKTDLSGHRKQAKEYVSVLLLTTGLM